MWKRTKHDNFVEIDAAALCLDISAIMVTCRTNAIQTMGLRKKHFSGSMLLARLSVGAHCAFPDLRGSMGTVFRSRLSAGNSSSLAC